MTGINSLQSPPIGIIDADTVGGGFYEGDVMGKVIVYSEQVQAGAKLVAEYLCHRRHRALVEHLIAFTPSIKLYWTDCNEDYLTVYIYKYPFVLTLIEELWIKRRDEESATALEVWATGKLFGYSDFEISQYLVESGLAPGD